jgi:mannose-6-phosphate isomerase-like protein (cupin superfamily)
MESHHLSALRADAKAHVEFLRKSDFSAGVYRLPAGGVDGQQPHTEDEVYFVVSGRARFSGENHDMTVGPGDILFVPAKEPHRFHQITEDLVVLVFFAPAEGARKHASGAL